MRIQNKKQAVLSICRLIRNTAGMLTNRLHNNRRWRFIFAMIFVFIGFFSFYTLLVSVNVSYASSPQSVAEPFVIRLNRAAGHVDLAALKLSPAIAGKWSVASDSIIGGQSLVFSPSSGFSPGTHYQLAPFSAQRLIGGTMTIHGVGFTTVSAPTILPTGLATLMDNSVVAPDSSFTLTLAHPNDNIRKFQLTATPSAAFNLTTSKNGTVFTWRSKQLLPGGTTLQLVLSDARNHQVLLRKQLTVASAPQLASFNEPTGFSQGDTAKITFTKAVIAKTAQIHFDVAGTGAWQSPTVYAFTPQTVQPGQIYHYTVATGIRSTDGGLTAQPLSGSFTAFGNVAVSGYSPTGSGLSQARQVISITFNHAVNQQSAASRFSISAGTVGSASWNGNTFSVPVTNLGYGQTVTVAMASGVTSTGFGLPSAQTTSFSFRTAIQSGGVTAQLAYAVAHWNDQNNATYGNLDSVGGDCANFVSQTLIARGWHMDSQWYDYGPDQWSAAWGYVPSLDNYLRSNASRIGLQYLTSAQRSQYAVGDVVIFSWEGTANANSSQDHTEMISQINNQNGQISVELASHNNYGLYRDLDEQITVEHPGATFHVWHLTQDTN